jgi:hypothetical protein
MIMFCLHQPQATRPLPHGRFTNILATVTFRTTIRYVKLILLFTQMEHTYPADWVFLSPDQSVN